MKCPNCGCETCGKFCSECGAKLPTSEQNQTNDTNTYQGAEGTPYFDGFTQEDVNPNTATNYSYTEQPPVKKKMSGGKIAIIVVSIVVGVLLVFGAISAVIIYNVSNMVTSIADIIPTIDKNDANSKIGGIVDQIESQIDEYGKKENFIYSDFKGGKKLVAYYVSKDNSVEKLVIPDKDDGKSVVAIGAFFSAAANYFSEVEIPDTVKTIDENAFCGCDKLKSATIPESVTSIGEHAFGYTFDMDSVSMNKIDDFKIYGVKDSEAEKYAKDNGFEFVEK